MLKIFATFLKKGSAKNFFSKKVLGYFSKIVRSAVISNRRAFFILSGFSVWTLMALCPSLKVFCFVFFKKRMGFGATPHKNGVFFLQSFFFCAFCAKRKSDVGVDVSLCQEFRVAFLKKSSAKNFLAERFLGVFKKSALGRQCRQPNSGFAVLNLLLRTSTA